MWQILFGCQVLVGAESISICSGGTKYSPVGGQTKPARIIFVVQRRPTLDGRHGPVAVVVMPKEATVQLGIEGTHAEVCLS